MHTTGHVPATDWATLTQKTANLARCRGGHTCSPMAHVKLIGPLTFPRPLFPLCPPLSTTLSLHSIPAPPPPPTPPPARPPTCPLLPPRLSSEAFRWFSEVGRVGSGVGLEASLIARVALRSR